MSDDQPTINGRVSQRDLYDAISHLRTRMDERFDDLDTRLRHVEVSQVSEQTADEARRILLAEQRDIKSEQSISKRWMIGLALGVGTSVVLSLVGFIR